MNSLPCKDVGQERPGTALPRTVLIFSGMALAFTITSYLRAPLLSIITWSLESADDQTATHIAEAIFLGIKLLLVSCSAAAMWRMAHAVEEFGPTRIRPIQAPAAGPLDPLLTLRAFALLQVLIGHLFMCVFVSNRFPQFLQEDVWLRLLAPAPWVGVWVFFTLSGYLMGKGFYTGRYSLAPRSVLRYLTNRFIRIVPIYASAVLLVSAMMCPEIFNGKHATVLGSILIFDYNGQERINPIGALWSVSTEVQFYALVPVLFWVLSRLGGDKHSRVGTLVGATMACGLAVRLATREIVHREGVYPYVYTPMLANLDLFVLGMLTNPLIDRMRASGRAIRWATVANAIALIGGGYVVSSFLGSSVMVGTIGLPRLWVYGPTVSVALTMIAIVCCELGSASQAGAGFTHRILLTGSKIGIMAYPLYVWHEPVLLNLRKIAPASLTMGAAIKYSAIAALSSWAVAEFVYRHVELPTLKWKAGRQRSNDSQSRTEFRITAEPLSAIAENLLPKTKAA
jgi:peptidoglycan/LPS O-acetylase OafA/YrhL